MKHDSSKNSVMTFSSLLDLHQLKLIHYWEEDNKKIKTPIMCQPWYFFFKEFITQWKTEQIQRTIKWLSFNDIISKSTEGFFFIFRSYSDISAPSSAKLTPSNRCNPFIMNWRCLASCVLEIGMQIGIEMGAICNEY